MSDLGARIDLLHGYNKERITKLQNAINAIAEYLNVRIDYDQTTITKLDDTGVPLAKPKT